MRVVAPPRHAGPSAAGPPRSLSRCVRSSFQLARRDHPDASGGCATDSMPRSHCSSEPDPRPEPATARRQSDSRIPWRDLFLRVFREDVLACPCGGRRKILAFIKERSVIEQILGRLGVPTAGPPTAPARLTPPPESPRWQDDVPELQQSPR